jgi:HlyD family secretion protein
MSTQGGLANGSRPRRIRPWQIALIVGAVLLIAGFGYSHERKRAQIAAATPAYQDIELTVSAQGTVLPFNDFQARANFSGMVDKIYVQLGEKVRAGQMLISMRDQYALSRVESARAALESSEVNNQNVQHNGSQEDRIAFEAELARDQREQESAAKALATIKQLEARGSASEAEVMAAKQRLDAADMALAELKRRMSARYSSTDAESWRLRVKADKAALAAEKVSYDNANLASPISGTVYLIPVRLYDFVPMGAELLHVADLSKIRIRADFYEQDVGKLQTGQPVKILWEGDANRTWHGRIASRPLAITRTQDASFGQCMIGLDDARGDLPVNTNVTAVVTVAKHEHALTIPREALHTEGAAHYVYRVDGDKLSRVPVVIGIVNPLRAEITNGLSVKDQVALHGANDEPLSDGLKIEVGK